MSYLDLADRILARWHGESRHKALVEFGQIQIHSRRYDCDIWLARDEEAASELRAEVRGADDPIPVFTFREMEELLDGSEVVLRVLLRARSVFPDARVIQ